MTTFNAAATRELGRTWTRANEILAGHFRDGGGTMEQYQEMVTVAVLHTAQDRCWSDAEVATELAKHLEIARKVWDVQPLSVL